jgi:CRISP-associated protein Cas1
MSTLYLTEPHSYVQKEHDRLLVRRADGTKTNVPLIHVDQVVVMGDITLSAGTVQTLLGSGIEICFCTAWGRYLGRLAGDWSKNSLLRIAQHHFHGDEARCLALAREVVLGKLLNMRQSSEGAEAAVDLFSSIGSSPRYQRREPYSRVKGFRS